MMKKQLVIWLFVCMNGTDYMYAQWTEKDSVWLNDIISGKEQIKLNPETMKAIESGTFINSERPDNQHLSAPPILPITKEFDITPADTTQEQIDYRSIPPAVFARYRLELDSIRIMRGAYTSKEPNKVKDEIQIGNLPITVKAGAQNLFLEEVKDGQRRGSVGASAKAKFSLDDILLFLLSPTERNKRKNKKRAKAWQHYNMQP